MANTLLRVGLWMFILVLTVYVLVSAYPEEPLSQMITATLLQQTLVLAGVLIAAGIVLRILGKGASVVVKNRCRTCRTPIPSGAIYCRQHLRSILHEEDARAHASRVR